MLKISQCWGKVILSDKDWLSFQLYLYCRASGNPSLHMMTFMIWPKGTEYGISKTIGQPLSCEPCVKPKMRRNDSLPASIFMVNVELCVKWWAGSILLLQGFLPFKITLSQQMAAPSQSTWCEWQVALAPKEVWTFYLSLLLPDSGRLHVGKHEASLPTFVAHRNIFNTACINIIVLLNLT